MTFLFQPMLDIETTAHAVILPIWAVQHLVTDPRLQDASCEAEQKYLDFSLKVQMRKNIVNNLLLFRDKIGVDNLAPEVKRCVERVCASGKRRGMSIKVQPNFC